jgi:hypothetical protein
MKISDFEPADYNPRKITGEELERLAASIRQHTDALKGWDSSRGFRLASTITVNSRGNRIVGGHQRVKALEQLEQDWVHDEDITWVDLAPGSHAEKALNVALNSHDAAGSFDWEALSAILSEAEAAGDSLDLFGLAPETLEPLLDAEWTPPPVDPNRTPGTYDFAAPVHFGRSQRRVFDKVAAQVRADRDSPKLHDAEVIMVLCEHYMPGCRE